MAKSLISEELASPLDETSGTRARLDLSLVYADQFKFVWRCLKGLGVPDRHLDDAVQEVFMVVGAKLQSFDGSHAITTWLYAIALRIARRSHRTQARERARFLSTDEIGGEEPGTKDTHEPSELERKERLSLAQRALAELDEHKREAFVLSAIEGLSAPEMVAILGLPLNTVYSRIRAARQAFVARVRELERAPTPQDPRGESL